MKPHQFYKCVTVLAALSLVAACGGGDDAAVVTPAPVVVTNPTDTVLSSTYAAGLAALNTFSGLTSASFLDLFDDTFKDAGYTKAQVRDSLQQESIAVTVSPETSLFPMVRLSNATITGCDAAGICTFTATVTNSDVDTVSTTFVISVKNTAGKYRLLGDQKDI